MFLRNQKTHSFFVSHGQKKGKSNHQILFQISQTPCIKRCSTSLRESGRRLWPFLEIGILHGRVQMHELFWSNVSAQETLIL